VNAPEQREASEKAGEHERQRDAAQNQGSTACRHILIHVRCALSAWRIGSSAAFLAAWLSSKALATVNAVPKMAVVMKMISMMLAVDMGV
jgi:hypothetical protein